MNKTEQKVKRFNNEWIKRNKRFNLQFNLDLLLSSAASLFVLQMLLVLVDWTDLSEVVEQLDLLSESVDLINLIWEVPFDRALLWAIMENYDTLTKGLKV